MKKLMSIFAAIVLLSAAGGAHAVKYKIHSQINHGGGFGGNVLHNTGTFAHLSDVSGYYHSDTGELHIKYDFVDYHSGHGAPGVVAPTSVEFWGEGFYFDEYGYLDTDNGYASLELKVSNGSDWGGYPILNFADGEICCSGFNPNSLKPHQDGGVVLALWGDNAYYQGIYQGVYGYIGADIRVKLKEVPLPAAVWLFGSAIVGLVGIGRRRNKLQAA